MLRARARHVRIASKWTRVRNQLGGGIAFGGLAPFLVALLVSPQLLDLPLVQTSFCASVIAIATGYYLFRSLIAFPGIKAGNYVLPSFSSAYAAAVVVLFLLRLGYSRSLLLASYFACITWYFFIYFAIQRRARLSIGVVPFGEVGSLLNISKVDWVMLDRPDTAIDRHDVITADFHEALPAEWERFLADAALSGVTVLHVKQLRESLTGRVRIEKLSENADGSLVPSLAYRSAKQVVDVGIALIALPLILVVFSIIGLAIKLDSPGPVFFRQTRIGYRGAPFRMWKFRSMTHLPPSTQTARDHAITQHNDKRVTRVGRFLRPTRLDELPQIINILRGQMSWIGPRPEAEVLSRWYEQEIPFYRYRHVVLPGITGWGQVNQGHVANVEDVLEKLHYDFFYISNFSLWLDLLIVARTVRTVMTGFGSK